MNRIREHLFKGNKPTSTILCFLSYMERVCVCEKERETDRQTQKKRQTSRRQEGKGIREEEGGKKNGDWDVKMI